MAKTKLKWTRKLPKKDGFYFWRDGKHDENQERVVVENWYAVAIDYMLYTQPLHMWKGLWFGPIKEPKV